MVEINQNCSSLENVAAAALHKPLVVVGIPAYNEEKTIARVVLKVSLRDGLRALVEEKTVAT